MSAEEQKSSSPSASPATPAEVECVGDSVDNSAAEAVRDSGQAMDEDGDSEVASAQETVKQEIECSETEAASADAAQAENDNQVATENVCFKVVFNKQKFDVTFPLDDTVTSLKKHIESLTNVPASMQKVMYKGKMQDDKTLRDHKVIKAAKIMVIGSTVNDVMSISAPDAKTMKEIEKEATSSAKEPLCKQKPHKTVLEKHGKPEDAMIGVKKHKEPLPPAPLSGMYNKSGGKVRLTFKLEHDQIWIGTKERTEKLSMGSIKAVVTEAITGHEEYHMVAFQLGPTEASRYWVYWVPAQYVDAIKDAVLGKWQTELF